MAVARYEELVLGGTSRRLNSQSVTGASRRLNDQNIGAAEYSRARETTARSSFPVQSLNYSRTLTSNPYLTFAKNSQRQHAYGQQCTSLLAALHLRGFRLASGIQST